MCTVTRKASKEQMKEATAKDRQYQPNRDRPMCYTEKAPAAWQHRNTKDKKHLQSTQSAKTTNLTDPCVTRRKHHRPGIAPNANTMHVPTAGSSAAPTKPNHTPSRHSRAKGKLLLQTVTRHALEADAHTSHVHKN